MKTKEMGSIIGSLLSAFDASIQGFVRQRIGEALTGLCKSLDSSPQGNFYKELCENIVNTGAPLGLIALVADKLPGEPVIGMGIPERGKEGFYTRYNHETIVVVGRNETGKALVKAMIEVARERAQRRPPGEKAT